MVRELRRRLAVLLGNVFQVVGFALAAYSFVDVLKRPGAPFDIVGQGSRNVWIFTTLARGYAAWIQGIPSFIGVLACILYLLDLRPKLDSTR